MASCVVHPMAVSECVCGRCGHEFCPECVVFPHGTAKPPLCITCALEAGGIRHQHTGRPRFSDKEVRRRVALQRDRTVTTRAKPEPVPEPVDLAKERWLDGDQTPEDVGGWSQTF